MLLWLTVQKWIVFVSLLAYSLISCDKQKTGCFSEERCLPRGTLPCLLSQFIIIILCLNWTSLQRCEQHSSMTTAAWYIQLILLLGYINWIKHLIISSFVHPCLNLCRKHIGINTNICFQHANPQPNMHAHTHIRGNKGQRPQALMIIMNCTPKSLFPVV